MKGSSFTRTLPSCRHCNKDTCAQGTPSNSHQLYLDIFCVQVAQCTRNKIPYQSCNHKRTSTYHMCILGPKSHTIASNTMRSPGARLMHFQSSPAGTASSSFLTNLTRNSVWSSPRRVSDTKNTCTSNWTWGGVTEKEASALMHSFID